MKKSHNIPRSPRYRLMDEKSHNHPRDLTNIRVLSTLVIERFGLMDFDNNTIQCSYKMPNKINFTLKK